MASAKFAWQCPIFESKILFRADWRSIACHEPSITIAVSPGKTLRSPRAGVATLPQTRPTKTKRLEIGDRFVPGHECFHDAQSNQIAQGADDKHHEIGGLRSGLVGIGEGAGEELHNHAANSAGHV